MPGSASGVKAGVGAYFVENGEGKSPGAGSRPRLKRRTGWDTEKDAYMPFYPGE